MKQCWIIAGAASAIAANFARLVAERGDQVILLGRDLEKLSDMQSDLCVRYQATVDYLAFDALKTETHADIAKTCMALAKHPSALFIAFGVMAPGFAATHTAEQALTVVNTNFTGVVSLTYAFLPYFKEQKQGSIVVLGSVAGDRGRASHFDYGAAKAALVPFCEGLRASLLSDHVSVTLMKMGYIDTPMTYGKPGIFLAADPLDCARACLKAADQKVALRYFPWFWRWIMFIVKMIPQRIWVRMKV